ncbi:acyl-CoA dehydrogenase family protein [Bacillus sp. JJ1521]|uniref:acyl-CoA dehydrogenase family protein n=1 Tax=Bacillus sp. JJ1521 TaxID=3122957 RepID=UPI002FFE1EEC
MDFLLTDEQKMIQQTVREFVDKELKPMEAQFLRNEREGRPGISKEEIKAIQRKAKDIGFWGINTPEEYGGANLGPLMTAIIDMELSRTVIPMRIFQFGGRATNVLFELNEDQKQRYLIPVLNGEKVSCFALSEPEFGSDPSRMQTTAVKDGNEWIINGEKTWITHGVDADFAILFARTDKTKGIHGGITCFLVDRHMGWKSEPILTMGEETPGTLIFENCRVPEENVIGEVGDGLKYAMFFINHNRGWVIPPRCVGIAERVLEMSIEYANTRVSFGKPIGENQAIQWMIADSAVEIEASKLMFLQTAWMAEQGMDIRHQAAMVKLESTNMVNRVVDRAIQIHGGMGYTKELPLERFYREVRVFRIYEGSDEICRKTIARNLLKGRNKLGEIISIRRETGAVRV